MNAIIFGPTGMVGQGVLLEALDHPDVEKVLSVTRKPTGVTHAKHRELIHDDFQNYDAIADEMTGFDACFWCLGITSVGLNEAAYTLITHDFTMAAATVLHERNPNMVFCFVSGSGADASEHGRIMWARVKGKTENDLRRVGFRDVVVFRPAMIQPRRGVTPRGSLRWLYAISGIVYPLVRALGGATSTVEVGKAMIAAAQGKADEKLLDSKGINRLAARL